MTREGKIAAVLLIVFGIMLTPPVVFWLNTDALVGGWPVMLLWAIGWAFFAVAVLAWAVSTDAFAINDDQVPPELARQEEAVVKDDVSAGTEPAPKGGEG